jgi:hypothetical protein
MLVRAKPLWLAVVPKAAKEDKPMLQYKSSSTPTGNPSPFAVYPRRRPNENDANAPAQDRSVHFNEKWKLSGNDKLVAPRAVVSRDRAPWTR